MRRVSPAVTALAAAARSSRRHLLARLGAFGASAGLARAAASRGALSTTGLWLPPSAEAATEPPALVDRLAARIADWDVPLGHFYTQTATVSGADDADVSDGAAAGAAARVLG